MTVGELVAVLLREDQKMKIAVHANNHLAEDVTHVSILRHYAGRFVLIGNQSKRKLNPPNWEIEKDIYGSPLPNEWWKP